jgi:hypothetical protein
MEPSGIVQGGTSSTEAAASFLVAWVSPGDTAGVLLSASELTTSGAATLSTLFGLIAAAGAGAGAYPQGSRGGESPAGRPVITVEEAARRLNVAPSTLYRHLPGGNGGPH